MLRPNEVKVNIGINDSVSVSFLAFFRFQSFLEVFYDAGYTVEIPPPRQPSGIVLASSAGGPGFNLQSRTASYQRRYKNGTSSTLV